MSQHFAACWLCVHVCGHVKQARVRVGRWVGSCPTLSQETRGPVVAVVACLHDDMLGSTGPEAEAFGTITSFPDIAWKHWFAAVKSGPLRVAKQDYKSNTHTYNRCVPLSGISLKVLTWAGSKCLIWISFVYCSFFPPLGYFLWLFYFIKTLTFPFTMTSPTCPEWWCHLDILESLVAFCQTPLRHPKRQT